MRKADLIVTIAEKSHLSTIKATTALEVLLELIEGEVAEGGEVVIGGFGKFTRRIRKGRMGVNPRTMEPMQIPERLVVHFAPSLKFKRIVRGEEEVE